jgi:hypothetical protein
MPPYALQGKAFVRAANMLAFREGKNPSEASFK